jgi:hypothetical protein
VAVVGARRRGARGDHFIGARGGERWSSADAGEVHSAGVNAAQRRRRDRTTGRYRARTRSSGEDGAVPNFPVRRGDGRGDGAREGTVVGGDRDKAVRGEDDGAADRWGQSASGSGRERGVGRRWAEGEGVAGTGGESGRGLDSAQPGGGEGFLFSFLFSNSISIFYILFF